MIGDLFINGKDAYQEWGISMGEGFLNVLEEPAPLKEYVTNSSRLEHGVQYSKTVPKTDERSLVLNFIIDGVNSNDFIAKRKNFYSILYNGDIDICVPVNGESIYHLKYTGKSVTYSQNIERTSCKIAVKFQEPNVMNRRE